MTGEEALLRVSVVAPQASGRPIPPVRSTFHVNGTEVQVLDIHPDASIIRDEVDESSPNSSADALIPASVIRPGLEMVVEIDPDGTLNLASRRIP